MEFDLVLLGDGIAGFVYGPEVWPWVNVGFRLSHLLVVDDVESVA